MNNYSWLACMTLVFPLSVQAISLLTNSPGSGFVTSYPSSHNLGYQFRVADTPLSVVALGFYDVGLDGLTESHQVGLWSLSGDLLASATVPQGGGLHEDGFLFEDLTSPFTLAANSEYILSAFWSSPADQVYANFLAGTNPAFTGVSIIGSRNTISGASPEFAFPSNSGGANGATWIGANLVYTTVPDSAGFSIIFIAFAALLIAARRMRFVGEGGVEPGVRE